MFLHITLILNFGKVCFSQHRNQSDSLAYQSQLELFDAAVGIENTGIINGTKYTVPLQTSDTHPFFNARVGAKGNITFVKQAYSNLTLLYDTYSDEIIVQQRRASGVEALIKLYKPNVESFKIHDHTFRNYRESQAQKLGIASGYYDVLFENSVFTIIAKRKKNTHVSMGRIEYELGDRYFFISNGRSTAFRGMKNFYKVLVEKDPISELRSFVAKNNLQITKSDQDLIQVARHCDIILTQRK